MTNYINVNDINHWNKLNGLYLFIFTMSIFSDSYIYILNMYIHNIFISSSSHPKIRKENFQNF